MRKKGKGRQVKKKIRVCVSLFEMILFLHELFTVDTVVDESLYWCLGMLALYSYCTTSRSIFLRMHVCCDAFGRQAIGSSMYTVHMLGEGESHSDIHVGTQVHTHTLPEPRG